MARQQPETKIKKQVRDYLRALGWMVFHNLQGVGCYRGLPDLTAIKNGIVLWIEIKTEAGRLSEHQLAFHELARDHGAHVFIARSYQDVENYIGGLK